MKQRRKLTPERKIAEDYIRSYIRAQERLDSALYAIERADSSRQSMTQTLGAIPMSGGQRDKMHDSLVLIEESAEKIWATAPAIGVEYADVASLIDEVEARDEDAGRALRMWYLDARAATYIAKRIPCVRKTVYALVDRGLDAAFQILAERGENIEREDRWITSRSSGSAPSR